MDPIEKLLSELSPTGAPSNLDRSMGELFERADRKRRVRRIARSIVLPFVMLAVGGVAGYRFGADSVPTPPASTVTYVLPMESSAYRSIVDATTTAPAESPLKSGSIVVTMFKEGTV